MDYAVTLSIVIPTLQVKRDRVVELQTNLRVYLLKKAKKPLDHFY